MHVVIWCYHYQIILIIHPNTDLGGYLQHWDVMGAKLINITVLQ